MTGLISEDDIKVGKEVGKDEVESCRVMVAWEATVDVGVDVDNTVDNFFLPKSIGLLIPQLSFFPPSILRA
jgi:hypothetical protein